MLNFLIYFLNAVAFTFFAHHLFYCPLHADKPLPWFFAGMTVLWWVFTCYGMIHYLKGRDSS